MDDSKTRVTGCCFIELALGAIAASVIDEDKLDAVGGELVRKSLHARNERFDAIDLIVYGDDHRMCRVGMHGAGP